MNKTNGTAAAPAATNQPTYEQLQTQLAAANAKLAVKNKISFKVGAKGGVSVYGMQRFPVTLFGSQWERLIETETIDKLKAFIEANRSSLATKE